MRIVGSLAFAAACFAITTAHAQHTMRVGLASVNDIQHDLAIKYAEDLAKATNGAIKVEIFPAGQLGAIPRQVENVKLGVQAAFISPPGFFSGLNRGFEAPDAPGIYKNYWHAHNAFIDPEFRDKFVQLGEKGGVVGVMLFSYGTTSIASLKPIRTLDDMKGLKVRVLATKMESKLASVLGMTGVPMPYGEVLPALQQNTIDGCRSAIAVMTGSKFFTVTKPITLIDDGMIPSGIWVSKIWLSKLPKNLQDAVYKTAHNLESWVGYTAVSHAERAEKTWKENGGEVIRLPAKDQAELMKRLAPLGEEFLAHDPATKDMYALLLKVLARSSSEPTKK